MNLAVAAALFANLIWGLAPVFAKVGLQNVNEVSFLLLRFFLSTVFLFPSLRGALKKIPRLPLRTLLLGTLTVAVHYYLQVYALKQAPVTWYVFFYSLCPILSLFAVRVRFSWKLFAVCFLAILGTLIFVNLGAHSAVSLQGLLALGASVVTWVLFTMAIREWQKELSDLEISATTNGLSLLVFATLAPLQTEPLLTGWNSQAVTATIALSLLLPLAFWAYSYSLRKAPSMAVLGQYSEPLFGTLGAVMFLGETLSSQQIWGLTLIAAALTVLVVPLKLKRLW